MFLEIKQNSQENTCVRVSFLIKLQASALKFWHRCFPVNFAKFLRTPFLKEHHWWLLLKIRLIHLMPLDSFPTPWKLQKSLLSYDVFRGYWKKSVLIFIYQLYSQWRATPVLEFLFNKVAGLQAYFEKYLWTAASKNPKDYIHWIIRKI